MCVHVCTGIYIMYVCMYVRMYVYVKVFLYLLVFLQQVAVQLWVQADTIGHMFSCTGRAIQKQTLIKLQILEGLCTGFGT